MVITQMSFDWEIRPLEGCSCVCVCVCMYGCARVHFRVATCSDQNGRGLSLTEWMVIASPWSAPSFVLPLALSVKMTLFVNLEVECSWVVWFWEFVSLDDSGFPLSRGTGWEVFLHILSLGFAFPGCSQTISCLYGSLLPYSKDVMVPSWVCEVYRSIFENLLFGVGRLCAGFCFLVYSFCSLSSCVFVHSENTSRSLLWVRKAIGASGDGKSNQAWVGGYP